MTTQKSFQNHVEEFVFHVCRETFLSLWSYSNPRRDKGKELSDVLVVCDPDVVVISVKEARLNLEAEPETAIHRWLRRAVDGSVKQLYGAVRWLDRHDGRVIRHDGSEGLPLPPVENRRIHRVSVSLGSQGEVPLLSGDYGKGFVHLLDERAFLLLMESLDTITDFIAYLIAKEELASRCPNLVVEGEENLVAVYLHHGRKFPPGCPQSPIAQGLWEELLASPDYQRKVQADRVSYVWDRLLEYFGGHALNDTFEFGGDLSENELIFREMALETRFGRRVLADALTGFFKRAQAGEVKARMCKSLRGIGYVFMNAPPDASREDRRMELEMRCFLARGELGSSTVIGICMNLEKAPQGHCEDVFMLRLPEWTDDHREQAQRIKSDLGYFERPEISQDHTEEYPPE